MYCNSWIKGLLARITTHITVIKGLLAHLTTHITTCAFNQPFYHINSNEYWIVSVTPGRSQVSEPGLSQLQSVATQQRHTPTPHGLLLATWPSHRWGATILDSSFPFSIKLLYVFIVWLYCFLTLSCIVSWLDSLIAFSISWISFCLSLTVPCLGLMVNCFVTHFH